MDERELRERIDRLTRQFAGSEPVEYRAYFATPSIDHPNIVGSAASAISTTFVTMPSGLLVPQTAARPAIPFDQILKYITASELLGDLPVLPGFVERQMPQLALDDVLIFVAAWLHAPHRQGATRKSVDLDAVDLLLTPPVAARARNLLRHPQTTFVVPQALFVLAKLACLFSVQAAPSDTGPPNLIAHMLLIAEDLGPNRDEMPSDVITRTPGALGREIVANQLFNSTRNEINVMARFVRRWRELPVEASTDSLMVDLAARFEEATGTSLDDLILIGVALWAASVVEGRNRFAADYFSTTGWTQERLDSALALICIDSSALRPLVQNESDEFGLQWSISTFERYPLLRLSDGSILVIDPGLLIARTFGWLPLFDAMTGFAKRGQPDRGKQVRACLEHSTEMYALEVLRRCVEGSAGVRRLYDDADLEPAFRKKGRKKADAAIDYGDSWVVLEVTTSQPKRPTVSGTSEESITEDLEKLVGEARQVEATINALKEDESRLTGHGAQPRRRYFPVVVASEGFPVNPITLTLLRERLADAGVLQSPDVSTLEVIDLEELEMLEGIQESGGPTLQELLEGKAASSLMNSGLRDYVIRVLRLPIGPSATVREAVNGMLDALARQTANPQS